jgi:hypothetical protein
MGSIRQSLQAQPKNIKKLSKHQINQSKKKSYGGYPTEFTGSTQNPKKIIRKPNLSIRLNIFPKKTMFSTLRKKRSQKFVLGLPDRICRLDLKS